MGLSVREINTLADPGLARCWELLAAAAPGASLCTTHAWAEAWSRTVGWRAAPAVLLFEDARGTPVGIMPACRQRHGAVRWLQFLGRERVSGDHLDLLCAPDQHAACCAALLEWCAGHADSDGLLLGELPRDGATVRAVRAWAAAREWPALESEPQVVPYADLPGSFDELLAGLSANMRYHVRRRRRELDRTPGARVQTLTAPSAVAGALEDLFHLHAVRWARDHRPGNLRDPQKQEFLHEFCAAVSLRGGARATVLECAGARVGVLLAFQWHGVASFYQMGWDPATPIESPGVLLLAESIADAIAAGCTRYDFLRGDEAYKRRWTGQAVHQTTIRVGWGVAARAVIAAERFKARVRDTVQARLGPGSWATLKRVLGRGAPAVHAEERAGSAATAGERP